VTDLELLEKWRTGDKTAGDEICRRHFDRLLRFFSTKAEANDIADLVQLTLLGAAEGLPRFRAEASVTTYLFAIARHQLLQYWKRRKKTETIELGVSSIHDLDPSPSTIAAEREEQRLLIEAMRRIPVDLQIAIELHFWEELSGPEIAEVLGVPEGTVRSRLRRALEALRENIEALAASEAVRASTQRGLDEWERRVPG
jgi:RNA polymerase sigma-70 factor (ECF subfamily)